MFTYMKCSVYLMRFVKIKYIYTYEDLIFNQ